MNKTKSIVTYVLVGLFIVLMAVLSFVEFPIGDYDYHGYANTIKLGLDLSGGVSAVFDVTDTDVSKSELEVRIQGAVNRLSSMLVSKGYTEAKVSYDMSGTYPQIRVEVPDVDDPESMFDLINRPASLQFVDSSDNTKVLLEGRDCIETAYVGYNQQLSGNQYYVGLKMNEKGTKIWEQVTSDLTANGTKTGTFTVLINGEVYMEKVQVSEVISTGSGMLTQGGNSGYTYDKANEMASSIQAGAFGVTLHLAESRVLGPVLGENAIKTASSQAQSASVLSLRSCAFIIERWASWQAWLLWFTSFWWFSFVAYCRGCSSPWKVSRVLSSVSVWQLTQTSLFSNVPKTNMRRAKPSSTLWTSVSNAAAPRLSMPT